MIRARYAFAGAATELSRTLPLAADEPILFQGVMRLRCPGVLPRPALLRLSPARLAVLAHYALRSDRVWDLPLLVVEAVDLDGGVLRIRWRADESEPRVLHLTHWTGRTTLGRAVRDASEAAAMLRQWRFPPDGRSPSGGYAR